MRMKIPEPQKWIPRNPKKYNGDHTNIIVRSSWERKLCVWLDTEQSVIEWSSEEVVVPYISPVDLRQHRYFVDFYAKIKTKDGSIKKYLIEVKPENQTREPKKKTKITKQYINEVATWGVNQAKWSAATNYAADRGWSFLILTEKHLKV